MSFKALASDNSWNIEVLPARLNYLPILIIKPFVRPLDPTRTKRCLVPRHVGCPTCQNLEPGQQGSRMTAPTAGRLGAATSNQATARPSSRRREVELWSQFKVEKSLLYHTA